jgi:hypothetical protein
MASVVAVVLETVPSIHDPFKAEFRKRDVIAIAVVTVEYLWRFYAAPEVMTDASTAAARWNFFREPGSLSDLIAIVPFYLQFLFVMDLRFMQILRIIRVLKLTRYNTALKTFGMVLQREKRAFADGVLAEAEIRYLEEACIRLHLSEERSEAMTQQAMASHAEGGATEFWVEEMVDRVHQMKTMPAGLPPERAIETIKALPLSAKTKRRCWSCSADGPLGGARPLKNPRFRR